MRNANSSESPAAGTVEPNWLLGPTASLFRQVPRALIVSGLAALLDVAGLVALVETLSVHPRPASAVSYFAGGLVQYGLSVSWVFARAEWPATLLGRVGHFVRFQLLSLVGLCITWGVLYLGYDRLAVHYAIAKVFALGLAFLWNFCSRKVLLFGEPLRPGTP